MTTMMVKLLRFSFFKQKSTIRKTHFIAMSSINYTTLCIFWEEDKSFFKFLSQGNRLPILRPTTQHHRLEQQNHTVSSCFADALNSKPGETKLTSQLLARVTRPEKKFTKIYLYGIVDVFGTQKCLKQNKNMRHFQGLVEHSQNLPPNMAEWAGSAWWIFHTCLMVSFHSKAF